MRLWPHLLRVGKVDPESAVNEGCAVQLREDRIDVLGESPFAVRFLRRDIRADLLEQGCQANGERILFCVMDRPTRKKSVDGLSGGRAHAVQDVEPEACQSLPVLQQGKEMR